MWKLCLYCDLKYLVSGSAYSLKLCLGTAHIHFGKTVSLLGKLGIWQLFLKHIWHLSHTEVIFHNSITYSVCLLTIQQHLNYRKVVRSEFLLHSKSGEKKPKQEVFTWLTQTSMTCNYVGLVQDYVYSTSFSDHVKY